MKSYNTLNKLILPLFIEIFLVCYLTVFSLSIIIKIFDSLDEFIRQSASFFDIINYFLHLSVLLISDIFPFVFPLSVLLFFMYITKTNELLALRSIGIDYLSIVKVFLFVSIFTTLIIYLIDFFLVPCSQKKIDEIHTLKLKKYEKNTSFNQNILKLDNNLWIIERSNQNFTELNNVIIFSPPKENTLSLNTIKTMNYKENNTWLATYYESINLINYTKLELTKTIQKELFIKDLYDNLILQNTNHNHKDIFSLLKSYFSGLKNNYRDFSLETTLFKKLFTPILVQLIVILILPVMFNSSSKNSFNRLLIGLIILGLSYTLWKFSINLALSGKIPLVYSFSFITFILLSLSLAIHRIYR